MFKFIHAADLHLDSPLRGLDRYEGVPADEVRGSTRKALQKLVQLAIAEKVAFVLISGDLYDGDWHDYNTGIFFNREVARLAEAGIPVYLITGNHDASNRMTHELSLVGNGRILSHDQPESVFLEDIGVAIHGQGFKTEKVTHDLSAAYPDAKSGYFNIGMLHTCLDGREGHAAYAPCKLDGLRKLDYDYWALGHIHQREVVCKDPWIIFPGNIQGRHIRETGVKGCYLVSVAANRRATIDFQPLDVLRWSNCPIDITGLSDPSELLDHAANAVQAIVAEADNMPVVARIEVVGAGVCHHELSADVPRWTNELRSGAAHWGNGQAWIEKVRFRTEPPPANDEIAPDGAIGEILAVIEDLAANEALFESLRAEFDPFLSKLPNELTSAENPASLAAIRELLPQVGPMLRSRLLGKGDGE